MSWRIDAEKIFEYSAKKNLLARYVYMFGVYTGESVWDIINLYSKYGKTASYYCFDSFVGLPADKNEDRTGEGWVEGAFNASEAFGTSSLEDTIRELDNKIKTKLESARISSLNYVPGFYNQSLTRDLIEKEGLLPALYVDIDCDLYSSTIDVFEWMYGNNLIAPGTMIGYDDWGGTPGWFVNHDGESRAHAEMCEKYKVKARKIFQAGRAYPHVHTIFLVESVG